MSIDTDHPVQGSKALKKECDILWTSKTCKDTSIDVLFKDCYICNKSTILLKVYLVQ